MPTAIVCIREFKSARGSIKEGQIVSLHPAAAGTLVRRGVARYATPEETRGKHYRTPSRRRVPSGGPRHQSGPGRPPKPKQIAPAEPVLERVDPAEFSEEEIKAATVQLDLQKMTVDEVMNLFEGEPLETLEKVRELEASHEGGRKTLLKRLDKAIEDAKAAAN